MRDRCYKDDRKHFAGDQSTTVHVCRHGSANVQGRVKKNTTPLGQF